MKIAVECHSPLLQKSLELFLQKYLTNSKKYDIVVRDVECLDKKNCFYIGSDAKADLLKPFSKSQLILALEKRYEELQNRAPQAQLKATRVDVEKFERGMDFEILERRIESLTQAYQADIIRVVKAFYEK